jgi:ABC-type transport system substrate-binding protein
MNKKLSFYSIAIIAVFMLSAFQIGVSFASSNKEYKSNSTQTRTDAWIEDLQANFNNPHWFFQNLNTADRLMVRQALDYAIPRTTIQQSIVNGFALPLETYQVPQVGKYFDPSVHPVQYNLTKASELLSTVFGYTWSHTDDSDTPYDESAPYFPLNLMVPNSNPLRVQWANLIQGVLKTLGVGSTLIELSFSNIIDRTFPEDDSILGWDYTHGGMDGIFIGWGGGTTPDDGSQWFQSGYIPNNNYQNVNSSTFDFLVDQENNPTLTAQQRLDYFFEMQNYVANQSMKYILFQNVAPFIYDKDMTGFNSFYAASGALPYQNMTVGSQNYMTMGVPSIFSDLMPLISNDVYSNYIVANLWAGGLLALAVPNNDLTQSLYQIYNNTASSYTLSADQMFYNFTLRTGVKWADGTDMNASDVEFTYKQILTPARNAISYGGLSYYMNNESIIVYDATHIGFNLTRWADPFPFGEGLFTSTIVPKATYAPIANWKSNAVNTGSNGSLITTLNANGPYQLSNLNTATGAANLTVNPLWRTSGYAQKFEVPAFNATPSLDFVLVQVEKDPTTAVADLKSGVLDYVDTNIGLTQVYPTIYPLLASGQIAGYNATGSSWQEMGLNQASPIWGYSPQDINYPAASQPTTTGPVTVTQTDTTTTAGTPFGDIVTIVGAIVTMGVITFAVRKRKYQ